MEAVKIFISGDFAPILRVIKVIEKGSYESLYNDMLPIIHGVDYAITNLEAPLAEKSTPIRKTGPNLKAPLKTVETLTYGGFKMVTLANNHALDQGAEGLSSTIDALDKAGIIHIGAGGTHTEASSTHYESIKGKNIAFINCCENEWSTTDGNTPGCNPLNDIDIYYQIISARKSADYVILIIHGGHETYDYPSPRMVRLYRWFVDLGVDAVIGHHTHCYSGREVYRGKPIIYSLGNFIFDHPTWKDNFWTKGCACLLRIDETGIKADVVPFHQCNSQVGVKLFNDEENKEFLIADKEKTAIITDNDKLHQEYKQFLDSQQKMFGAFVEPFSNKLILALKKFHIIPSLLKPSKRLLLLNLIRCEAHRDILINHLNRTCKK